MNYDSLAELIVQNILNLQSSKAAEEKQSKHTVKYGLHMSSTLHLV